MQATFIENPNLREKILQWIINNIKRRRTYESDRECDRWTILNRCTELNAALFRSANSEGKWSCRVLQNYTSSLSSSYYTTSLKIADTWVSLESNITKVNTTQWYSAFVKFDLVWLWSTEFDFHTLNPFPHQLSQDGNIEYGPFAMHEKSIINTSVVSSRHN